MKSLQLTKPHIIVVVGIPGSGKTFFAEQFSKTFSAPFLNHATVASLTSDSDSARRVWEYTLDQILMTKQTVLLETATTTRLERRNLSAFARTKGYQILFVWVQTEPLTAEARATKGVPGQKSNNQLISSSEFESETKRFEPLGAGEQYMVISGKHTYASQARNVLKKLVEPRADGAKTTHVAERDDILTNAPTARPGRITIN
jgi:predicted kinase